MADNKQKEIEDLKKKLTPILEKMIGHLIVIKPEDPVAYMLHFLEKQIGKGSKKLTPDERVELGDLRALQEYFSKKLK